MNDNDTTPGPGPVRQRGARLKIAGILILLFGLIGAGLVYWLEPPPEDMSDDISTARAYKTAERNIEINFGKMGLLITNFTEDLKDPGVQAGIIVIVSMLASAGCFYFDHLRHREYQSEEPMS